MAAKKAEPVEKLTADIPETNTSDAEISGGTVSNPADPWEQQIEMMVPRKPKGEEQQYYVCVNDRRYLVPANGKLQLLPKPIALALADSLANDAIADDFAEKIQNRLNEAPAAHAF